MIILDTNVISELMRPSPSPNVVDWGCRASSSKPIPLDHQ